MTTFTGLSGVAQAASAPEPPLSFGEALSTGGSVIVFGLAIVFVALGLLILITYVYPKISKMLTGRQPKEREPSKARKSARKSEAVSAAPHAQAAKAADDTALIAAITAAVAASLGTSPNGIMIKSISRARQNIPAWGRSGRSEQICSRF